MAISNNKT